MDEEKLKILSLPYEGKIPTYIVSRFTTNDIPELLPMLSDFEKETLWKSIIHVIGQIGSGDQCVIGLVNFAEKYSGKYTHEGISAMFEVPHALAKLASKGNRTASEYLVTNAQPELWKNKRLPWKFSGRMGEEGARHHYMCMCTSALAHSGIPNLLEVLESLRRNPNASIEQKDIIEALLKANKEKKRNSKELEPQSSMAPSPPQAKPNFSKASNLDTNRCIVKAKEELERLVSAYKKEDYNYLIQHLADNGRPLDNSMDVKDLLKMEELMTNRKFRKGITLSFKIFEDLKASQEVVYGAPEVSGGDDENVIVRIPVLKSSKIIKHYIPANSGGVTLNENMDAIIYMVAEKGKWYWNPFGW